MQYNIKQLRNSVANCYNIQKCATKMSSGLSVQQLCESFYVERNHGIFDPLPSARPSVLLPEKVVVTEGEDKTILCDITGFYPEKLVVTWQIQNGSRTIHAGAHQMSRVCTEMAIHNEDGTYSIRSGITLHSSAVKGEEIRVICQVEHQTYNHLYNRSVILTVQGGVHLLLCTIVQSLIHTMNRFLFTFPAAPSQPGYSAGTLMVVTCVFSLFLVTCVIGGSLLLYRYFGNGM